MQDLDTAQRFLLSKKNIRGVIVRIHQSLLTILKQHDYPDQIRQILSEALLLTSLVTASLKFEGQLTFQFVSESALELIVTKCDDQLRLRGLIQWQTEASTDEIKQGLGEGEFILTLDQRGIRVYQSIVPLQHHSIKDAIELYFQKSEQLPTKFWISLTEQMAAGLMLQVLPEVSRQDWELFWQQTQQLDLKMIEARLNHYDNLMLVQNIFPEDEVELYDPKKIEFFCPCTREKMSNAVLMMGESEVRQILKENKEVVVTCEYCGNYYAFNQSDINELFSQTKH